MKRIVGCAVFLSILWVGVSHAEMRIWTSKKGDTIEATYVRIFAGGKVVLKTSDGRELKIPIDGLSAKDQDYLASLIPPQIKISVDVDTDIDTEQSTDWYVRKRETSKCKVTLKKANKEPCNRTFSAHVFVFALQERGDDRWLISLAKEKVSFAGSSDTVTIIAPSAEVQYESAEYQSARGFRYDGYLVVVLDEAEEVLAMDSNRNMYKKNWSKIKGAKKGVQFDRDFDQLSKKRSSSF